MTAKLYNRATLKAFLTHICVLKILTADRGQQKGKGGRFVHVFQALF
jgi:hypothetical protein